MIQKLKAKQEYKINKSLIKEMIRNFDRKRIDEDIEKFGPTVRSALKKENDRLTKVYKNGEQDFPWYQ